MSESHTSAESLNELGNELKDQGRLTEAELAYVRATEAEPAWSVPWYNLGLLYKIQRRWADSVRCNQRAVDLNEEDGEAWWNLGIAATALGDWSLARRAWRGCKIEMAAEGDEPRMDYGLVLIRLATESQGEVVWCDRIDPARAIIRNVPLPASRYREGDLVLHDGAPNGYRVRDGRKYPVFDALQVLVPSGRNTYQVSAVVPLEADLEGLRDRAEKVGVSVEDWETITRLCTRCSEGVPHEVHDHGRMAWTPRRRLGVSARSEGEVRRLLDDWAAATSGVRVISVEPADRA